VVESHMTRDKIDVKDRADKVAPKLVAHLAKEREEGDVGSKEGYSSGCLGCLSWFVVPSIVDSC
jgi:hypothetical protein